VFFNSFFKVKEVMKLSLAILLLSLISACGNNTISYQEIGERTHQSKEIAKKFGMQLKSKLQAAMKEGGPINAISVCNEQAPLIAKKLSEETGWDIHRTSLKPRARKPDDWETAIMQDFTTRLDNGDKFDSLSSHAITKYNGKPSFRFMQAIETQKVCLVCHGENIAEPIKTKIAELYPNDVATRFKEGDIRGAFSIIQPLE